MRDEVHRVNEDGELFQYPENYSPTEYMTHDQWEKWTKETKEIMSEVLGVSPNTLSYWERGKKKPDEVSRYIIQEKLGITVEVDA